MGLAERRAIKDFQDKHLPGLQKEIQDVAGFAVPFEITWDQLATEGQGDSYAENWTAIYFKPVLEALRSITRDEMGKEALRAGLKKIEFRNSAGNYSPTSAIKFEGGTILIDHDMTNVGDVADRAKYLTEIVEKAL